MSGSFVDYLLPTSADTISFDVQHNTTASTTNTLGTKGVGEAGTIASTPAVVNAVVDAVRHLGINDIQMPCTPERVWRAIHDVAGSGTTDTEGAAMPHFDESTGMQGTTDRTDGAQRVIPTQFDYLAPSSVEEALAALAEHGDDAKVIAGGQSLLPVLRMRLNAPEVVIDLGGIEALRGIREDGDALVIGAMTTHHTVLHDPLVAQHAALLAKAEHELADAQIRHRGTIGGALAHADPAGDLGAPSLALGAEFVIAGPGGTRTVPADDVLRRPLRDRDRRGRAAHRDPGAQAHRLGRALREVRARRPPVADRGGRRGGAGRGRHHRRGAGGADQHGVHAAACARRRGGPGRAARDRGRRGVRPRPGPPRAPTRPPTSTAPPTTAPTWPRC